MPPQKEPPFRIIIDSREQLPYEFPGIATVVSTLKSGDYSLEVNGESWGHRVACERKSFSDCWSSMSVNRARFERCVKRLAELDRAAIVVEASLSRLAIPPPYIKRTTSASVIGGLISWSAQFAMPVFFCDSREQAERVTLRFLAAYFKHRGGVQ